MCGESRGEQQRSTKQALGAFESGRVGSRTSALLDNWAVAAARFGPRRARSDRSVIVAGAGRRVDGSRRRRVGEEADPAAFWDATAAGLRLVRKACAARGAE